MGGGGTLKPLSTFMRGARVAVMKYLEITSKQGF